MRSKQEAPRIKYDQRLIVLETAQTAERTPVGVFRVNLFNVLSMYEYDHSIAK